MKRPEKNERLKSLFPEKEYNDFILYCMFHKIFTIEHLLSHSIDDLFNSSILFTKKEKLYPTICSRLATYREESHKDSDLSEIGKIGKNDGKLALAHNDPMLQETKVCLKQTENIEGIEIPSFENKAIHIESENNVEKQRIQTNQKKVEYQIGDQISFRYKGETNYGVIQGRENSQTDCYFLVKKSNRQQVKIHTNNPSLQKINDSIVSEPPVEKQASFPSASVRECFREWLKNGNAKKYSTEVISVVEKSKLIGIIADKFKNGFRMSSSIDFERFKNYYADEYGKEFQYTSDSLHDVLSNEALVFDDRAYMYGEDVLNTVRMYLKQLNSPCIYIDAFFNKFSDELYALTIFSVDMLRAFIEKNYYDISVKWDYILLQENISPSDLIKDVFSERETWSFYELQERLPFLKMDTIRQTLNGAEYYRVDKDTYTHINNIELPESEGEKIVAFVVGKLQERDYVIANELDLSKFENLNPHCSFTAVRDAVFYKFLSNSYDKSGQVITRKGCKLHVLDIMEQYCREADTVSLDELNAFEATFDPEGRTHSQSIIAGHNTMVRVSRDLFVSDSKVDFDVTRIDEAIALYCYGNFIPLRGVTDFSLFPYAGYQWNLFLLESYVRRFSYVFRYDVRAANSANIGAIVRKSFEYDDYDYILALALAKSSVMLSDKKAVGDYLFNNGYIGWRNLGKSEGKIIKIAKELRKGDTL